MSNADELTKQVNYLAETLRETATELLRVTDKINKAYRQYAEYLAQVRIEAAKEPPHFASAGEDNLRQDYTPFEEVGMDAERPDYNPNVHNLICQNCSAPRNPSANECLVCGVSYE